METEPRHLVPMLREFRNKWDIHATTLHDVAPLHLSYTLQRPSKLETSQEGLDLEGRLPDLLQQCQGLRGPGSGQVAKRSGAGAERERSGRFVRAAREGGLGKGPLHTHRAASLTTIPNKRRHDNNAQSRRLRSKPNAVLLLYYYCTIARTLHDAQTRSLVLCAVVLCVARAKVTGKRKNPKSRIFEKSGGNRKTRKFEFSDFRIFACRARKDVWKAKNPKSRKFKILV